MVWISQPYTTLRFGLYETIIFKRINLSMKYEDSVILFRLFSHHTFSPEISILKESFFRLARRLKIASLFGWFACLFFFCETQLPAEKCKITITMDVQLDGWIASLSNHSSSTQSWNYSITKLRWRGNILAQVFVYYQG